MSSLRDHALAADVYAAGTKTAELTVPVHAGQLHLVQTGPPDGAPIVFLHGWPQTSRAWAQVMHLAAKAGYRALALDLPGVGGSRGASTDGSTDALAAVVRDVVESLALSNLTLVGHDLGGMVAYSYLRTYDGVARAVIMNTVVPGVSPWDQVLANPYVWHFAFHSIADLPELLVQGRQRLYFDYFFDVLSPERSGVSDESRAIYAEAYGTGRALTAGFDWYRKLGHDAAVNAAITGPNRTPLLYLRGEHERGDIDTYVAGFRDAGLTDVRSAVVEGAGHFSAEDAPVAVWDRLAGFIAETP